MSFSTKDYSVVVHWSESSRQFVARCLEIPASVGADPQEGEAVRKAFQAIEEYLEYSQELGRSSPTPVEREYSGKLLLRVPRTLHRLLAERAVRENVSLNQYISTTLAQAVIADNLLKAAEERLAAKTVVISMHVESPFYQCIQNNIEVSYSNISSEDWGTVTLPKGAAA